LINRQQVGIDPVSQTNQIKVEGGGSVNQVHLIPPFDTYARGLQIGEIGKCRRHDDALISLSSKNT